MFCKLEKYISFRSCSNEDYILKLIDLEKIEREKKILKLNLMIRNEECNCSECKLNTSNWGIKNETNI